jgi:Carboxypeptidase regulatory-like domain
MTRTKGLSLTAVALMWTLFPGSAAAQQASGIAGTARDTSGGVLPGVTVEATSPALIEKVRTVVTDDEGRYNIVDLRPGTYSVTFTLPGFRTIRREAIVLTAGFTAAVNAELQVGAVEETVTVSAAAPMVDTQNVRTQNVVSNELLEVLPNANKSMNMIMTLTPGLNMAANSVADVTGGRADFGWFHGKTGTKTQLDGMGTQNLTINGATGYIVNGSAVEEMTMQTSGISAETGTEGALANFIPKEGANTFSGSVFGLYTNRRLQANNMTDILRARGLPENNLNKVMEVYDAGITLGGPIKRDRLWFFVGLREWGNAKQGPGYFNQTQGTPFYTSDLSRPAGGYQWYSSKAIRITWQASPRNKINVFIDPQRICQCGGANAGNDPIVANAFHQHGECTSPLGTPPSPTSCCSKPEEGSGLTAGTNF